jgi:hypothetical protein
MLLINGFDKCFATHAVVSLHEDQSSQINVVNLGPWLPYGEDPSPGCVEEKDGSLVGEMPGHFHLVCFCLFWIQRPTSEFHVIAASL